MQAGSCTEGRPPVRSLEEDARTELSGQPDGQITPPQNIPPERAYA